uniref:Chloroplast-targeted copper chaperone n=1 Tax=Hirschfeldia incana TaxID=71354 RepID=V9NJK1_HIRIN|nr:chloroplast-targeted copper chaperone [Hirschfeldia incana]
MRISDIFCSSPASTAVRRSTLPHDGEIIGGRRSVDSLRRRQNPNNNRDKTAPCFASEMPFIPIPRPTMSCRNSFESSCGRKIAMAHGGDVQTRRKSSADVSDVLRRSRSSLQGSSSSRYLLKDHKSSREDDKDLWLSSSDRSKDLIPFRDRNVTSSSSSSTSSSSSSSVTNGSSPTPSTDDDQVVVLRVSIHCKGCEGKVRKHISKMEGVTSYTIDIATKKVTVVGKVTPSEVVESISRVKSAQLWPSSSSPSFPHVPNHSLIKS